MRVIAVMLFLILQAGAAEAQKVLWYAGMEKGNLSEWSNDECGGEYNSGISDSYPASNRANTGRYSVRMTITTPSAPTSGTRLFRWCEPRAYSKLYYSAWYFVSQSYDVPNYWNIWQWKSKTSNRNDPFFIVNIGNRRNGNMYLYFYDWQNRKSYQQSVADVPVGRWFQIEGYYQCAANNTGRAMIWQDGKLLFDVKNVRTRYDKGDCQWSLDNYSDMLEPNTSSIYIDDAAIGQQKIGLYTR